MKFTNVLKCLIIACLAATAFQVQIRPAVALSETTLKSVVSVLPLWPGKPQGGSGVPTGKAPEGSGIVVGAGGLVATAYHVVEPAIRTDVRLYDGRIVPAELVGADAASDIALLRIPVDLPPFERAVRPALADRACIIANAYGLDLTVTCGVISARNVANAGFNAVEDFYQTDAAANPGSSGGALVDEGGRLIGMVSAIFASSADTNIGVNYAVSKDLLDRVVAALKAGKKVAYFSPGWGLELPPRAELAERAGVKVVSLAEDGPAAASGIRTGDLVVATGSRRLRHPRDLVGALALVNPGETIDLAVYRDGKQVTVPLRFIEEPAGTSSEAQGRIGTPDCPYAKGICATRQAVFPVESFDPLASSVRIAVDLLVTNRHVIADRETATVFTPAGPLTGRIVPSSYEGDLALIEVEGLPGDGLILDPASEFNSGGALHAVGADIAQRQVRVFQPGEVLLGPDPKAPLGRLHVTSFMQPGVSGGALVDDSGRLAGIAVGGGQGRFEAIPLDDIRQLVTLRNEPEAVTVQKRLGQALANCATEVDAGAGLRPGNAADEVTARIKDACLAADNQGLYLEAGRILGQAGKFSGAIELHEAAVRQTPNSLNARLTLLVSLQLAGRFEAMLPHARFALEHLPKDPQALRFAIQSGVWAGDPALAEKAYAFMAEADPRQAQAARRFIDSPPPKPRPR
jgi:S1-C subfamily serine protease